jgi:hypothetical protein
MSYVTVRGRWCDIIVLSVHAPMNINVMILRTALRGNGACIASVPLYHMKLLLGDFNAKSRERRYFKTNNLE